MVEKGLIVRGSTGAQNSTTERRGSTKGSKSWEGPAALETMLLVFPPPVLLESGQSFHTAPLSPTDLPPVTSIPAHITAVNNTSCSKNYAHDDSPVGQTCDKTHTTQ